MSQDKDTRNYRKEYLTYQGKPAQKKHRAMRNAARRELEREGLVHKGDGKDVDHKKMLDHGGSNSRKNLRVVSVKQNRGWERDA